MDQILVYSDSATWGIIPGSRNRLPFEKRWPGVLEIALLAAGKNIRIIENCLNGRRTAWSDPFKPGRDGSEHLGQVIEMHSPLSLVLIMLGTNDFQATHQNSAAMSAQGMAKLVNVIRQAPVEPGMQTPKIMVIAPVITQQAKGAMASKFVDVTERSSALPEALMQLCDDQDLLFFDANSVVNASVVDGVHLDEADHTTLGNALAAAIKSCKVI